MTLITSQNSSTNYTSNSFSNHKNSRFKNLRFSSPDNFFLIQLINKEQFIFIKKNLSNFFNFYKKNKKTFILKIFGLYKIKFYKKRGFVQNMFFYVTNNVFYDGCNGCDVLRVFSKECFVVNVSPKKMPKILKNFKEKKIKEKNWKICLEENFDIFTTLQQDIDFLCHLNITDYSLLIKIQPKNKSGKKKFNKNFFPSIFKIYEEKNLNKKLFNNNKPHNIKIIDQLDVDINFTIVNIFVKNKIKNKIFSKLKKFFCFLKKKKNFEAKKFKQNFLIYLKSFLNKN